MARDEPIIALFDDRAQALRLRDELQATGLPADRVTLAAGSAAASDRRDVLGTLVEAGIARSDATLFADEVCGGATLLIVRPRATERARVAEVMIRHAPTRTGRPQAVTDAIPGDGSSDRAPEVTPMPTGSGSLDSPPQPAEDDER